jgi:hypothetical protein
VLSGVANVGGVTYWYSNILNRVFVNGEWKTLSIPTTDIDSHIITIKTDNLSTGSSNDNQFTLPATGTYDIDWGDGTIETGLTGTQTHTYANIGTYEVRISNGITSCIFDNGGDRLKLLEVKQWGTGEWDNLQAAWYGCSNVKSFPSEPIPTWSLVTSLVNTWYACTSLTTAPDVSNLINVTSLVNTWRGSTSLTTAPDISNLINVTSLVTTWFNSSSLTELLSIGFNIENVTNATNTASGVTLDTSNYDAILIDWHARLESIYPSGVGYPHTISTSFGSSQYTLGGAAEAARTALINDFGWTIADGGGI